MIQTIEATIDEQGTVLLHEEITLSTPRRALVIILDEEPYLNEHGVYREPVQTKDWPVVMPKMSETMTEGTLLGWRKRDGEKVSSGEMIAAIRWEQSTVEVEAEVGGMLHTMLGSGQTVPVGYTMAIIRKP